jgi:cyclophilin family peptidyl-prolyl cis-trans isomerase
MKNALLVGLPIILIAAAGVWFIARSSAVDGVGDKSIEVFTNKSADSYGTSTPEESTPGVTKSSPVVQSSGKEITNNHSIMNATFHTNKGDIAIELDTAAAPKTVENFVKLAQSGFYNGVKFHRVIPGFMIQGGDPLTKDDSQAARWGTGGPGYTFADEIHEGNANIIGSIAMANAGPNTNGSQFFINVANNSFLNTKHTVFGHVTAGMDVVKAIESTPTGQNDRPIDAIVINSITLK